MHCLAVIRECNSITFWVKRKLNGFTIKEKYKDYLYINIMPDERQNITFYQKHGFTLLEDGAAMQIRHL